MYATKNLKTRNPKGCNKRKSCYRRNSRGRNQRKNCYINMSFQVIIYEILNQNNSFQHIMGRNMVGQIIMGTYCPPI